MGKGTDSLKRELGKNTGKWISNKVFGDGHSTPYRNVTAKVQLQQLDNDLRKAELKAERQERRNENIKGFFATPIENNEEKQAITQKRDAIITTPIATNKEEIMDFVNFLLLTIKANGWVSGNNDEHINSLSDTCLSKLEQCFSKLKMMEATNEAAYLGNEIKKLNKKKLLQKYLLFVGIAVGGIVLFVLFQLGVIK